MEGNIENTSRLETLLLALGVSQKKLSETTGLSRSAISQYATGERQITGRAALKIQKIFPNVNADWLLTGEGDMLFYTGSQKSGESEEEYSLKSEVDALKKEVADLSKKVMLQEDLLEIIKNLSKSK